MNQLVSEVKRNTEEIKRLKGKVNSLDSVTTGNSSGTTSGVLLSDNTPLPVTDGSVGDPGLGTEASRWDHDHPFEAVVVGRYRQFVYDSSNPFEFVTDGDGQPIFSLEDLE